MNKRDAKKIALELWDELASKALISKKYAAAYNKYKIGTMLWKCPLCEYFYNRKGAGYKKLSISEHLANHTYCAECPLGKCANADTLFTKWRTAIDWGHTFDAQDAAREIYNKIKAWKVR